MKRVLEANAPALLAIYGCGTVSAAALAVAGGGNPERLKSEPSSPPYAASPRCWRARAKRNAIA